MITAHEIKKNPVFQSIRIIYICVSLNDHPYNFGYLVFFETIVMGKTADLAMIQKTIIDTLHKEGKSQKVNSERGGCSQQGYFRKLRLKRLMKKQFCKPK